MKGKSYFKKIIVLMLALVLGLGMAIPTMAAGEYSITVQPSDNFAWVNPEENQERFVAYQIFSGELVSAPSNDKEEHQLKNIAWGTGIDGAKLVNLLTTTEGTAKTKAFFDEFKKALSGVAEVNQASAVADVLSQHLEADDADFIIQFSRVAAKAVQGDGTKSAYEAPNYVINSLDAGYYLVVDTDTKSSEDRTSTSQYILEVVRDREMKVKADAPELQKKIVEGEERVENGGYELGEAITYELEATLPSNYDVYETYFYKFIDNLSESLTYNADAKIVLKNAGEEDVDITSYATISPSVETEGATLTAEFTDLKTIPGVNINSESKIVLTYTAFINDKAVMAAPNVNTAQLEFSNNPNEEVNTTTSKTPEDDAKVYTIGLDITKQNSTGDALENVGFKLYKMEGETKSYAVLSNAEGTFKVSGEADGWTNDAALATEMKTSNLGKLLVNGLGEGTYYLEESTVPAGYDKMKDIKIVITVTDDLDNPVTVTIDGSRTDASFSAHVESQPDKLTLVNYRNILPSTGGIGTVIFYVAGAALIIGAVVFIVISNKKKKTVSE